MDKVIEFNVNLEVFSGLDYSEFMNRGADTIRLSYNPKKFEDQAIINALLDDGTVIDKVIIGNRLHIYCKHIPKFLEEEFHSDEHKDAMLCMGYYEKDDNPEIPSIGNLLFIYWGVRNSQNEKFEVKFETHTKH